MVLWEKSLQGVSCLISTACRSWEVSGAYTAQTWCPQWLPWDQNWNWFGFQKNYFTNSNDLFMLLKLQKKLQSLFLIQRLSWDRVQQLNSHIQPLQPQVKLECHSLERSPPLDWTVYILYPIDRPDLHLDLHQCRICLFFPTYPTHSPSVVIKRPQHLEIPYHGMYCLGPDPSMVRNHMKIQKNSIIRDWIGILNKIWPIRPCHTPNLSTMFHPNQSTTLRYPAPKQTRQTSGRAW